MIFNIGRTGGIAENNRKRAIRKLPVAATREKAAREEVLRTKERDLDATFKRETKDRATERKSP